MVPGAAAREHASRGVLKTESAWSSLQSQGPDPARQTGVSFDRRRLQGIAKKGITTVVD